MSRDPLASEKMTADQISHDQRGRYGGSTFALGESELFNDIGIPKINSPNCMPQPKTFLTEREPRESEEFGDASDIFLEEIIFPDEEETREKEAVPLWYHRLSRDINHSRTHTSM